MTRKPANAWERALRIALLLALALGLFAARPAAAQPNTTVSEREVKAAFLYRFLEYVRWPAESFAKSDSPIQIGIVGDPAMVTALKAITAGRTVRGRPIGVHSAAENDLDGFQLIFVSESQSSRLQRIARLAEGPVLIVSETPDGLDRGGIINFVLEQNRVRFEVALAPATARSLTIASGLLSVARNVRKESGSTWPLFADPVAGQFSIVASAH
jgi:hypothetical protein